MNRKKPVNLTVALTQNPRSFSSHVPIPIRRWILTPITGHHQSSITSGESNNDINGIQRR
jgi:hypothetical protein